MENLFGIIWATGFTGDRSWLPVDALTRTGEPRHARGVSALPGLLFLGLKWQYRRSSHTIDGVGRDAEYRAEHIMTQSAERAAMARSERPIRQEMQRTTPREGVAA